MQSVCVCVCDGWLPSRPPSGAGPSESGPSNTRGPTVWSSNGRRALYVQLINRPPVHCALGDLRPLRVLAYNVEFPNTPFIHMKVVRT